MKPYIKPHTFLKSLTAVLAVITLVSCGANRQGVAGENDGIYGSVSGTPSATAYEEAPAEGDNRNYYKQYFQSKAKVYENEPTEDVIFTDVEGYTSSNAYVDQDGNIIEEEMQYSEGQAGWGENAQVSINIYNNPGFGFGGFHNPWMWHRPHWWYGSGWGISYWNAGWGWAHPFYGYGFYGGFGYPAWGGFYGHPYHSYAGIGGSYHNNIAYNRGRRNMDYGRNANNMRNQGRSTTNTRAQSRSDGYTRSEMNRRINNSRTAENARRSTNSRVNQSTRGNQRMNTTRQNTTRQNTTRTNRNMSRQNQNTNRNISRPPATRSSGSMNRGGGGTMRSGGGGGMRGGGGGRRGGS